MDEKPPTVYEELNRKVVETMLELETKKTNNEISDYEYSIAVKAIASCVLGLVDKEVTEIISHSENIPVHTLPAYVRKPTVLHKDGLYRIFWTDSTGIHYKSARSSIEPGPLSVPFRIHPEMQIPQKVVMSYNKWLSGGLIEGWQELGND